MVKTEAQIEAEATVEVDTEGIITCTEKRTYIVEALSAAKLALMAESVQAEDVNILSVNTSIVD